ncbi:MAG TPA: MFS transporter [Actinomycetes bacterium]|nr:MFS transporter [Actinomycetes bacterium]
MTSAPSAIGSRRGFAVLLAAEAVSRVGSRMSFLALPWFVWVSTHSPAQMGIVGFAEMLPYVIAQAFGGPLLDRIGAKRASVIGDLVAVGAVGAIPLLAGSHLLSFWVLLVLVAVTGAARGAADNAKTVLLPSLIGDLATERATGLHDGVARLATLIGAPLGGVLIGLFSAQAVLVIDAASFAFAALAIGWFVPGRAAVQTGPATRTPYLTSLREGFRWLRHDRLTLGIGAMLFITNLADQAVNAVLLPLWAAQVTGTALAAGVVSGVLGLGALAGSFAFAALGPRLPRRLTFALCFLVLGAPRCLVFAVTDNLPTALSVALIAGVAAGSINPILGAVAYERIPPDLLARVFGAVGAVAWAGIPLGGLIAGALVPLVGLSGAFAALAVIYFAATLAPFFGASWRQMDDRRLPAGDAELGVGADDGVTGVVEPAVREHDPATAGAAATR